MSVMKLQRAIECDATAITLDSVDPTIAPVLTAGGHALLTIYTLEGSEQVIATGAAGATLTVVRRDDARRWPMNACVKLDAVVNLPLPPSEDCCEKFEGLTFGPEFDVTRGDCTLGVRLKATGVVAGDYCGFRVDAFGRILDIPEDWPASCLPVFNPCGPCDDATGSGGAASAAYAVHYTAQAGARVATGTNVQTVIEQLEDAVVVLQDDIATSVEEVQQGDGVLVSGLRDYPVVSLAASGVSPGTYAGFAVDRYGRIVAYTDPGAAVHAVVAPASPTVLVTTDLSGAAPLYTIGVIAASTTTPGVVTITKLSEIQDGTVVATSTVPDYSGVTAAITAALKKKLPPDTQTAASVASTDWVPIYNTGTSVYKKVSPDTLAEYVGPNGCYYDVASNVLSREKGVAGVAKMSTGVFRVTLKAAMSSGTYHVSVTVVGGGAAVMTAVRILSATVFEVLCFGIVIDTSGATPPQVVSVDPPAISLTVHNL